MSFFKIKHVLAKIAISSYFQSYEIYFFIIFRAMIFRSIKFIIFRAMNICSFLEFYLFLCLPKQNQGTMLPFQSITQTNLVLFYSCVCGVVRTQRPNTGYLNLPSHLDNQRPGWKQSIKCDASLFASKSEVAEKANTVFGCIDRKINDNREYKFCEKQKFNM